MPNFSRHHMIEFDTVRDVDAWSARFNVSGHELMAAVRAVGHSYADVEAYLTTSKEPVGAYVDRMRSRLDEIESQFQQLTEERKKIVAFLEGFAQLQRGQRPANAGLTTGSVPSDQPEGPLREFSGTLEDAAFRANGRLSIQYGTPAPVVNMIYQLLSDEKRRTVHEILAFLEVRGVPLKGANAPAYLSTLLSRDPRFDANRRDGWGLAERR